MSPPMRSRIVQSLILVALVGLALAAGFAWGVWRRSDPERGSRATEIRPSVAPAAPTATGATEEPVEVTLTPEAVERAGIKTHLVASGTAKASITVPGTVTSNAYRDTKAVALVGGIVRNVSVELGSNVARGQALAAVFSTDLADAQTRYLSARAMLEADHQKLVRTEKLVTLGAASRQELEEVTAVHTAHETEVAAARQRLLLLGLKPERVAALRTADDVVSEVTVPSPGAGVVIARNANPGQVVSAGQELFVVADLSTVWVIGDLYEKDFAGVRVGTEATVSVPASPATTLGGRVSYIDPRVDPATRTAKVRIETRNPSGTLRLGMFVNVIFSIPAAPTTLVPRAAVQSIGERNVVYVTVGGEDGRFVERTVKLGAAAGDTVEVLEGVKAGERVVVAGSFFLRAEAARTRPGG